MKSVTDIQAGSVVTLGNGGRHWVVLEVTEGDIERGVQAETPGLCGFGGMWYGDDPLSIRSYGKIDCALEDAKNVGAVSDFEVEEMKRMVD